MYRIFLFFVKYNGAFVFVFLEVIALSFYFTRNINPNKEVFISSANGLIGNVYETTSNISRYWNLSAVNDSLARENAELKIVEKSLCCPGECAARQLKCPQAQCLGAQRA